MRRDSRLLARNSRMPLNLCVPFERRLFIGVSTILFAMACGATPSAGKQSRATPLTSENGSQMAEPGRCSRSSNPDKEISCLEHLAGGYQRQGEYAEAEPLLKRALTIGEETLPPGDPYVTQVLRSLLRDYFVQNKWADAEPIYERILEVPVRASEAECGGEHTWGDEL